MSDNDLINDDNIVEDVIEEQKFDVLAVPGRRAFVVSPDKKEEFLNIKPNLEIRQKNAELVKKFRINNLNVDDFIAGNRLDFSVNEEFVATPIQNINNSVLKRVKKPDKK